MMEVADRTRGRPQGRAHRARGARTAACCCARSPRRRRRTSTRSRTPRATATSTPTRSGSTCRRSPRARAPRRRARPAADPQPQDGRPVRHVVARGLPDRDRDGRRARRHRGRAGAARAARRASRRSRRPTTCSRCAPTPTRSPTTAASSSRRARAARRRSSTSTRDHFKLVGDFEPRFAAGAPSLRACDAPRRPRRRHVRRRRRRPRRRRDRGRRRPGPTSRTARVLEGSGALVALGALVVALALARACGRTARPARCP